MSWVKNNEWLSPRKDSSIRWTGLKRFLKHYRPFRGRVAIAACLALLGSAAAFLIPPIFGVMQRSLVTGDLRLLCLMVLAYVGVLLFQSLVTYFISLCRAWISTQLTENLLLQYYQKLLNVSVEDFIDFKQRTNLFQRVIDAMGVTSDFTEVVIQGTQAIVFASVMIIVIGLLSPVVLGVVITGAIILFTFAFKNGDRLREKRQNFLAVNYPLVGNMLEAIQGMFIIKALAASTKVTSDIGNLVRRRKEAEREELLTNTRIGHGTQIIFSCTLAVALGTSFALLIMRGLDYWQAFALYLLVGSFLTPVAELARLYQSLSSLSANVRNYYQVIDIPDEFATPLRQSSITSANDGNACAAFTPKGPPGYELANVSIQGLANAETLTGPYVVPYPDAERAAHQPETGGLPIMFRDVDFAYRSGPPVFHSLRLDIQSGERISLIGKSGVGKTTLLRLLMGFLTPQHGTIMVGGVDISTVSDKNAYRRQFGLVSQQDFFFETSIRENLLFGLDEGRSQEEIADVLRKVNLLDHIESMPDKLNTIYSADIFSGGQKQRFFIARALLRKPRIVLLDEPTSALDFENEAQVIEAIETLAGGRTTITIAHRFSTVHSADRLVVLNDHRVVASGSHDELYACNEYYRAFCEYNSFIL